MAGILVGDLPPSFIAALQGSFQCAAVCIRCLSERGTAHSFVQLPLIRQQRLDLDAVDFNYLQILVKMGFIPIELFIDKEIEWNIRFSYPGKEQRYPGVRERYHPVCQPAGRTILSLGLHLPHERKC